MKTVGVSKHIGVPASAVWEAVRTGANMDRWVPAIVSCELQGTGVGAKRVCVISEHELFESIETVDDTNRLFQYRIHNQTMLPVSNVIGSIHISPIGPNESQVFWFLNFDLEDESAWPAVKTGIEAIYASGIDGLETYVASGQHSATAR